MHLWCNGPCREWTRRPEFKSYTKLFALTEFKAVNTD